MYVSDMIAEGSHRRGSLQTLSRTNDYLLGRVVSARETVYRLDRRNGADVLTVNFSTRSMGLAFRARRVTEVADLTARAAP